MRTRSIIKTVAATLALAGIVSCQSSDTSGLGGSRPTTTAPSTSRGPTVLQERMNVCLAEQSPAFCECAKPQLAFGLDHSAREVVSTCSGS